MQTYSLPQRANEGSKWVMGAKLGSSFITGNKNTPGPGGYDPDFNATSNKKPKYTIKGRYSEAKRLNVPGPGTYQKTLVDKKSAPSFGFGTSSQREPIKQTLSPGPGGYKIPVMIADVPAYAMPSRKEDYKYK